MNRHPWVLAFAAAVLVGGAGLYATLRPSARSEGPKPQGAEAGAQPPGAPGQAARPRTEVTAIQERASELICANEAEKAQEQVERGLALQPDDAVLNRQMGDLLAAQGAPDAQVARYYVRSLKADPRQRGAWRMANVVQEAMKKQPAPPAQPTEDNTR